MLLPGRPIFAEQQNQAGINRRRPRWQTRVIEIRQESFKRSPPLGRSDYSMASSFSQKSIQGTSINIF